MCDVVRRRVDDTPYRRLRMTTIANGIDTARYDREQVQADPSARSVVRRYRNAWAAGDGIVFGSQAGTDDYKGWMDLAHAVAALPPPLRARVRIALAGAMPSKKQRAAVSAAGLAEQVFFVGPRADVRPFIAALDVGFVLSWRVETISFACREMMAMGVPVIVSDHGGLPENITSGEHGWIVERRNLAASGQCV